MLFRSVGPQPAAKHLRVWVAQCLAQAQASGCPRRQFGALIIDPERMQVVAQGYNGWLRGGTPLCGGDVCRRTAEGIPSGEQTHIGCIHAEVNAILNVAASTASSRGAWMVVNGESCRTCAKEIIQAGIVRLFVVRKGYTGDNGLDTLRAHGVEVDFLDGPVDPRSAPPS